MKRTKDAAKPVVKRRLEIRKERVRQLGTQALDQIGGGKRVEVKTGLCNATTI